MGKDVCHLIEDYFNKIRPHMLNRKDINTRTPIVKLKSHLTVK